MAMILIKTYAYYNYNSLRILQIIHSFTLSTIITQRNEIGVPKNTAEPLFSPETRIQGILMEFPLEI